MLIPLKLDSRLFKLPRTLPHHCRGPRGPFRGLPRHMLFIVCFRQPSAACFARFASAGVGAEKKGCFCKEGKSMLRRWCNATMSAGCFGPLGLQALQASFTQKPLSASTVIVSPCFSIRSNRNNSYQTTSFCKPSAKELPSAKPSAFQE